MSAAGLLGPNLVRLARGGGTNAFHPKLFPVPGRPGRLRASVRSDFVSLALSLPSTRTSVRVICTISSGKMTDCLADRLLPSLGRLCPSFGWSELGMVEDFFAF